MSYYVIIYIYKCSMYIYIYSCIFELYGLYMVYIWNLTMLEQQDQLWMSLFIFYESLVFDMFFRQLGLLPNQDFHGFSALPNPGFWDENQDFPCLLT